MATDKLATHAVILAGGRGTRFWPRSRTRTPKQLLNIVGKETMLEQTVARLRPLIPLERTWTVTNAEQAAEVRKQLPAPARRRVLTEPVGRNTAAAMALAALHVRHSARGDALLAVLPADHYIANPERYRVIVRAALDWAREKGRMVVLGIPPTRPETGFGYIERMGEALDSRGFPVFAVRRFTEKPALAVAKEYAGSGDYHWNAGMFFWRASTFLENLRELFAENVRSARIAGREHRQAQLRETSPRCISHARKYFRRLRHPRARNARAGQPPRLRDSRRSRLERYRLVDRGVRASGQTRRRKYFCRRRVTRSTPRETSCGVPSKFIAAIGVRDLVVVDTPDALLICPRERAQDVGKIVKKLEDEHRKDLL